jgi:hypothetical protein
MDAVDDHSSGKWPSMHPFEYPACISPVHHARFHPDIHRYPMKQVITQLAKINKFELMAHNLERRVNYSWVIHGSPYVSLVPQPYAHGPFWTHDLIHYYD